ncbi:MAG: transglycosylase SLT domain-containing protein, partial [Clostridia bacterium]|nr:transglycosylase SLT domain-containing protein [Clostridia bacterium]
TKEELEPGMLYDPDTNIRYGTYMLSYLYTHYNRWEAVYAAFKAGHDTVDVWLSTPSLCDDKGNLKVIPDNDADRFVRNVKNDSDKYRTLYYK